MMKYLFCLFLSLNLILLSLPANAVSIAMVVWRGQTEAEQGFLKGLEELGYDTEITILNANQDRSTLSTIIRMELDSNLDSYDYVYSFGTTVTKALKTHLNGKKPHIFNIVSFPAESGILPTEEGGQKNTAGVSSRVLTETQIKNALGVIALEKVAIAFNPREPNSTQQLERMIGLGKTYGFEVVPLRIRPNENIFMSDLEKIEDHLPLSAIYFPSDSFLISKAEEIINYVNDYRIPSICAVSAYIEKGCFMGTTASYEALGKLAASIVKLHQDGIELSAIPVKFDLTPIPTINQETQKLLELNVIRQVEK